jgi:hypothetical protein
LPASSSDLHEGTKPAESRRPGRLKAGAPKGGETRRNATKRGETRRNATKGDERRRKAAKRVAKGAAKNARGEGGEPISA